MLFRTFAKADEGEMSRRLADLVRREACADVGRGLDLGAVIRLGASEAHAGGRGRPAILADACEALIGAVFVDGGYPAAAALVERLWSERMRTPSRPLRDSKTVLQRNGRRRAECPRRPIVRSSARARTTVRNSALRWSFPSSGRPRGFGPLQACRGASRPRPLCSRAPVSKPIASDRKGARQSFASLPERAGGDGGSAPGATAQTRCGFVCADRRTQCRQNRR